METQTLTLAEFLLARIAEDEAIAGHDRWDDPPFGDVFGWGYDVGGGDGRGDTYLTVKPSRIQAECEAKRQIVEHCAEVVAVDGWEYDDAPNLAWDALYALAQPYADHPDYREEWRA